MPHPKEEGVSTMILRKAIISIFIFLILLIGAWYAEHQVEQYQYYHLRNDDTTRRIVQVYELQNQFLQNESFEPFQPRQYVRIIKRNTE